MNRITDNIASIINGRAILSYGHLNADLFSSYNKEKLAESNHLKEVERLMSDSLKEVSKLGFRIGDGRDLKLFLFEHPEMIGHLVPLCKELNNDFTEVKDKVLFIHRDPFDPDDQELGIWLNAPGYEDSYVDRILDFYGKPVMAFRSPELWVHITDMKPRGLK